LDFANLVKYARIKGINLLGTGDFTHPVWLQEIKKLRESKGLFYYSDFAFVLSGEISLIYTQNGKGRRVHLVLLAPSIEAVEKINSYLDTKGRRDYDGRPIFNISAEEFTKQMMLISREIELIPAHVWTPWFGMFGSMSGFNNLKEAFGEQEKEIHAIETGMSSDPEMNWHVRELNDKSIVSFSDSHSFWPFRLGREATIFNKVESYADLIKEIRENSFVGTIETDPCYGKYHYDGHRLCKFSSSPAETKKLNGLCPVCGKKLTIGVDNRVEELTNQKIEENKKRKEYFKLLPLHELIVLAKSTSLASKKSWDVYNNFVAKFGNEFNVLLLAEKKEMLKQFPNESLLIDLILRNREGKIKIKPGYDGEYGEALLEEKQQTLV
jgi:uncharacterized protein (TIGR00375 family)